MNDLDWLCRNVHEWPKGVTYVVVGLNKKLYYDHGTNFGPSFTYQQWLTRRAELQNKPSWDDAPDDAKALVYCPNLFSWKFEKSGNLYPVDFGWTRAYWTGDKSRGECLGDWRNTLERRPERNPSEKTEKALDEAEDIESAIDQLIQDVYKNKPVRKLVPEWSGPKDGLPPVGMECESHLSGSLWEIGCLTYIGNNLIVWKSHTGHEYATRPTDRVFRPLRTEEDKAVEEMLSHDCDPRDGMLSREQFCRELYRAGYRKIERESGDE